MTDENEERWVLVNADISQSDPSAVKSGRGLQQPFTLDSWFVPQEQATQLLPHLPRLREEDRDLVDAHGHVDCCYAGEIGWSPHACYHRHSDFIVVEAADQEWRLVSTTETVIWEGALLDCSIGESVSAVMPSAFVQSRSNLVLDERGPSWCDGDGVVVFTNYRSESTDDHTAFLVRASWLQAFLKVHNVHLLIASWYERRLLDENHRARHLSESVYSAARIDADSNIHVAEPIRERR